jgi:hypothetical protein
VLQKEETCGREIEEKRREEKRREERASARGERPMRGRIRNAQQCGRRN